MASGRFTRFLNLEKPRRASDEAPPEVVNKARFEPQPAQEIPLAMDDGEQPFIRCPSCEADNNRVAEKCFNCQRSLLGEDVRAWNAAFWQKRKAAEGAPGAQSDTERQRLLGEALAASVAQREKARLWWWQTETERPDTTPAGMKLLGLIRDDKARMGAALGMAVTFLVAAWVALAATNHPGLRICAGAVAVLLFGLFVPNSRRGPRWWGSD